MATPNKKLQQAANKFLKTMEDAGLGFTISLNGKDLVSMPAPIRKLCNDCHDLGYDNCVCECREPLLAESEYLDHQCSACGYKMHKI